MCGEISESYLTIPSESPVLGASQSREQMQRLIDGCQTDGRVVLLHCLIDLAQPFGMLLTGEDILADRQALRGHYFLNISRAV